MMSQKKSQKRLICLYLPIYFFLLSGFATLDGDRTKWPFNPSYQINGSYGLADGSDLTAIQVSFQTWNAIAGIGLNVSQSNRNANITVDFLNQWPAEVGESAAGVTYTYRQNGEITQADIHINTQHFQWSTQTPTPYGLADIQGVVTHEIGHALGLTHSFYRVATMYWSGGEVDLRDLDEDDLRGMRFLYGGINSGLMCDTCQSNDDCRDGTCIDFGNQLYFCGQSCQGACPAHSACYMLSDGSTSCLPEILACSDMAQNVSNAGDYCFGGAQCAMNTICLPTDQDASCVALNQGQYGQACQFDAFCASNLCLPLDDQYFVCSMPCDPNRNLCPNGDECYAVNQNGINGLCVPSGNAREGEACGDVQNRCASGLSCLQDRGANLCRNQCDPFGACPNDLICTPEYVSALFGPGGIGWLCRNLGSGQGLGSPCGNQNYCDAGLYCDQISDTCVKPCQTNQDCTSQESCTRLNVGIDICKPNTQNPQEPQDQSMAQTQDMQINGGTMMNPESGHQNQAGTEFQAGTDVQAGQSSSSSQDMNVLATNTPQISLIGSKNQGCDQKSNGFKGLWTLWGFILIFFLAQKFRRNFMLRSIDLRSSSIISFISILSSVLLISSAFALIQQPKPLSDLIKQADMIVIATVSDQVAHTMDSQSNHPQSDQKRHSPIYTTSTLKVDSCLSSAKNACPDTFKLRQIGGKLGEIEMLVSGSRILLPKEQVILILRKSQNPKETDTYFLMDLLQSTQTIEQLKQIKEMLN